MAYTYRYLTAEQRAEIGKRATAKPAAPVVDDSLLAAWEADLVAHTALLDAATDPDVKARHVEAINTLEKALKAKR